MAKLLLMVAFIVAVLVSELFLVDMVATTLAKRYTALTLVTFVTVAILMLAMATM